VLLPGILGGVAGATVSIAIPWLLGAARQWVPRWFGFLRVAHVRTVAGAIFGLTAAAGISLSISDHSHKELTYIVWYGLAAFALVVVIVTTVVIERQLARDADRMSKEQIATPTSQESPHSATMNPLLRRLVHEHRGRRSVLEEAQPSNQPLSPAERRRIAGETEGKLARSIHDADLEYLDERNKAQDASRTPSLYRIWPIS